MKQQLCFLICNVLRLEDEKEKWNGMLGVSPKHYGTAITTAFSVSAVASLMEESFVECMNYLNIQIGKDELQV